MKQILPTTTSKSQQPVAETPAVQSQDRHATGVPVVPNDEDVIEPQPVDTDHDVTVHDGQDQEIEVVMPLPVSLQASESEPMPSSMSSGALPPPTTTGPCPLTSPVGSSRPHRMIKLNTKYDPEIYDLTQ